MTFSHIGHDLLCTSHYLPICGIFLWFLERDKIICDWDQNRSRVRFQRQYVWYIAKIGLRIYLRLNCCSASQIIQSYRSMCQVTILYWPMSRSWRGLRNLGRVPRVSIKEWLWRAITCGLQLGWNPAVPLAPMTRTAPTVAWVEQNLASHSNSTRPFRDFACPIRDFCLPCPGLCCDSFSLYSLWKKYKFEMLNSNLMGLVPSLHYLPQISLAHKSTTTNATRDQEYIEIRRRALSLGVMKTTESGVPSGRVSTPCPWPRQPFT